MISNTVANALASSTSSQQPESSSPPSAATDDAIDSASFSSLMANAKAASSPSAASTPQSGDAPRDTSADSAKDQPMANAQSDTQAPSSSAKAAGTSVSSRPPTTSRPAASGRSSPPAGVLPTAKNPAPLTGTVAKESDDSPKGQTNAKCEAGKTPSDAEMSQASTTPTAEASVAAGGNSSAPADASVGALVQAIATQPTHSQLSAPTAGDPTAFVADSAAKIVGMRASDHADATGAAGVAIEQGESQPVPTSGLISSADGSVAGAVQSFAMLFGRPTKAEGQLPNSNTPDPIADSAQANAGLPAPASPIAALAGLAVAPNHAGAALGLGAAEVNIATRVGDPGFGQDISRQLVFLAKTGAQSAELSLEPAELGPVSVSIQMNGLQASLVISASHAVTRAALQDALPHLGELFQSSGLQLADAQVGDGSARNADQGASQRATFAAGEPLGSTAAVRATVIGADPTAGRRAAGNRLIDTFA